MCSSYRALLSNSLFAVSLRLPFRSHLPCKETVTSRLPDIDSVSQDATAIRWCFIPCSVSSVPSVFCVAVSPSISTCLSLTNYFYCLTTITSPLAMFYSNATASRMYASPVLPCYHVIRDKVDKTEVQTERPDRCRRRYQNWKVNLTIPMQKQLWVKEGRRGQDLNVPSLDCMCIISSPLSRSVLCSCLIPPINAAPSPFLHCIVILFDFVNIASPLLSALFPPVLSCSSPFPVCIHTICMHWLSC